MWACPHSQKFAVIKTEKSQTKLYIINFWAEPNFYAEVEVALDEEKADLKTESSAPELLI